MATVFVSYSRSDRVFVRRLVDHLKAKSFDCWLDVDRLQAGQDWSDAVWSALQECSIMLLVVSPASMSSKEVANEWKYYHNSDKPIIPVLVDSATNIHYQLVALHYIDFDRHPFERAAGLLEIEIARTVRELENQPKAPAGEVDKINPSIESAEPQGLPVTNQLDPSKLDHVIRDRTTTRIDRDLAQQLEDRLHHFDEQMMLELISYDEQDRRIETKIRRGREYVLGRSGKDVTPDVDLSSLDAAGAGVSRKHAAIKLDGDTLFIKDLQSTNNTYVEGKKLRGDEQLALKSGDRVQLGSLLLIVYFRPENQST